jgi:tRNA-dihydrouridine synthase 3
MIKALDQVTDCPVTVKIRTGIKDNKPNAHKLIPRLRDLGVNLVTLHGRSRQQRYTKLADWDYISSCADTLKTIDTTTTQMFGNGDILSHIEYYKHIQDLANIDGIMIGRGALIKPWIFTEIKERRIWDISSSERFDMLKKYANFGLEHWGSDTLGINTTRRFMCEQMSFLHRYIPAGILEVLPQKMNDRPLAYFGRNELETLMASTNASDWVKLTERILGPAPEDFKFTPKHKSNSYDTQG